MHINFIIITIAILLASMGCSSVSSSNVIASPKDFSIEGPIFLTQIAIPDGIEYKEIGVVRANARAGYSDVESLYPLLASEARNIGANAIFNIRGGRRVTAFSWAAPTVSGTAVKVNNPEKLEDISGSYH